MRLTMNNTMIQYLTDCIRYREDKPSKLDLLLSKGINLEKNINYEYPFQCNWLDEKGGTKGRAWEKLFLPDYIWTRSQGMSFIL